MRTLCFLIVMCALVYWCNAECDLIKAYNCVQRMFRDLNTVGVPYLCENKGLSISSKCKAAVSESQDCVDFFKATPDFLKNFHDETQSQKEITEACKRVDVFNKTITCVNTQYPGTVFKCLTEGATSAEKKFEAKIVKSVGNDTEGILSATCELFDDVDGCLDKGFRTCGDDIAEVAKAMFEPFSPRKCSDAVVHSLSLLCLSVSFFVLKHTL